MPYDDALLARLSPEARLLLLTAAPARAGGDDEIAAAVRDPALDWERLMALADRDRASAIVWRRVRDHAPPSLDPALRERFETMAMVADFTASILEERVGETLALFASLGVEAVALKGTALAATVYGSFFERPMGDIDLVVPAEQATGTWEAAQEIGWRWNARQYPVESYVGHHHLPPLVDARGLDVKLELHTGLFVAGSPFVLSVADLEREGRVVRIGKGRVRVPSREHLLLHTCIHFAWSHMMTFGSWRAFRDVMALRAAGIDWEAFAREARRNRAESSCYWTLRLAERLAGAELPAGVMAALEGSVDPRWVALCERHVVRELFPVAERCPSQWLRRRMWELAIRPERSGQGEIRPWILDDMSPEGGNEGGGGAGGGRREAGVVRVVRQLSNAGAWWRYARGVLR